MQVFDIATMGTSLTAGSGSTESFHRDLAAALRLGKQSSIRLYNHGIPNGTTASGIADAARTINMKADAVLVEFSMNDCLSSLSTAETNTIALLDALRAGSPGSRIFLVTMNPVAGSSSSATTRSALPTFYQLYRDLSVSEDVGLIDTFPEWESVNLSDIPDGVHPIPSANRSFLIPTIASQLRPLID